jgi:hypothetical protein
MVSFVSDIIIAILSLVTIIYFYFSLESSFYFSLNEDYFFKQLSLIAKLALFKSEFPISYGIIKSFT